MKTTWKKLVGKIAAAARHNGGGNNASSGSAGALAATSTEVSATSVSGSSRQSWQEESSLHLLIGSPSRYSSRTTINELDDVLLGRIFSQLPASELLMGVERVNRRWRRVAMEHAYVSIRRMELVYDSTDRIKWLELKRCTSHLRELLLFSNPPSKYSGYLEEGTAHAATYLKRLLGRLRHLKSLRHLSLEELPLGPGGGWLKALAEALPQLRTLAFHPNYRMRDDYRQELSEVLASHLPHLQCLDTLSPFDVDVDVQVVDPDHAATPSTSTLALVRPKRRCSAASCLGNEKFLCYPRKILPPTLRVLDLVYIAKGYYGRSAAAEKTSDPNYAYKVLEVVVGQAPQLGALRMSHELDAASLMLVGHLERLVYLEVNLSPGCIPQFGDTLRQLHRLNGLSLYFINVGEVLFTGQQLEQLLATVVRNAHQLTHITTPHLDESAPQAMHQLSELRYLRSLTFKIGISTLLHNYRKLRKLVRTSMKPIIDKGILEYVSTNVPVIWPNDCMLELVAKCQNLRCIDTVFRYDEAKPEHKRLCSLLEELHKGKATPPHSRHDPRLLHICGGHVFYESRPGQAVKSVWLRYGDEKRRRSSHVVRKEILVKAIGDNGGGGQVDYLPDFVLRDLFRP